jgi:glucose/mannose-6-phosphate isomerase
MGPAPLDSLDMRGATLGLSAQVAAAAESARAVEGLPSADGLSAVLIIGMGGSGIGGDVAAAVAAPGCRLPVLVSKHYECPAWVGPSTLVIASSFSGNTEETLAAAGGAAARGARMVVLTSGGELTRLAGEWGAPVLPVDPTIPMPRAGIGAVAIPPLVALESMGLLEGVGAQVDAAVAQLARRAEQLSAGRNPAERLAHAIGGRIPLVYGGGQLGEVAAWRWKGQFNENPKLPSWPNRVPELTHNEIA